MQPYREERTYTITLRLSAEFPDDYEGDDDGFAWHERFDRDPANVWLREAVVSATRARARRAE